MKLWNIETAIFSKLADRNPFCEDAFHRHVGKLYRSEASPRDAPVDDVGTVVETELVECVNFFKPNEK